MAVFQLIPENDLLLENGDFVMVDGSRLVRQTIASRFRFYLGEWFLDVREGVPYYRDILVKNPDLDVVRSTFRQVLTTTPGVLDVLSFSLTFDPHDRVLHFAFEVQSTDGPIEVVAEDEDFIIRL